jgi:hypothetical protein
MKISEKKFSFFSTLNQNFPHIPYVASKTSLERKKIPSVIRLYRRFLDEIRGAASSAVFSSRKLKFRLPATFKPTWCTSNSEV